MDLGEIGCGGVDWIGLTQKLYVFFAYFDGLFNDADSISD
jgi:hypothetical protein